MPLSKVYSTTLLVSKCPFRIATKDYCTLKSAQYSVKQNFITDTVCLAGLTTYVIAVGDNLNDTELEAIATDPDSEYLIPVADFSQMDSIVDTIVQKTCAASG